MARIGSFLFLAVGILSTSANGYGLPGKQLVSKIIDKASKCELPTINLKGDVESEQNVTKLIKIRISRKINFWSQLIFNK